MKRHLNLMSERAQVRGCLRTCLRQWSAALAVLLLLLIPLSLALWWPVYLESQQVSALEAQYEPIRRLREASRALHQNIDRVRAQEKIALSLAKIDTPVVTLLGLVGQSVAAGKGQVFVEELHVNQNTKLEDIEQGKPLTTVEIKGRVRHVPGAGELVTALQAALPRVAVELQPTREGRKPQQNQSFTIRCNIQ